MSRPLTHEQAEVWSLATRGPWPIRDGSCSDKDWMSLALTEATRGVGLSSPNPPVGCVITKDNRLLGQGVHLQAGQPHAEVLAIQGALQAGEDLRGSTAYITLEPCCHVGRTPPCTDALTQAGIRRVVIGAMDLNPRVNGGGVAILKSAGLDVVTGVLEKECVGFHEPFFKWVQTGRPWVTAKLAIGSDRGVGVAEAITSKKTQDLAHALRRVSDAIMVGSETIRVDNPRLTDRWPTPTEGHRIFNRIVMVGQKPISERSAVFQFSSRHNVFRISTTKLAPQEHIIDIVVPPDVEGRPSLPHALVELGGRNITRLLLEGGPTLTQKALDQKLVDEVHLIHSPKLGGGPIFQPLRASWEEYYNYSCGHDRWAVHRQER